MLKFCANASCALKQEDLKWASLGHVSNGERERRRFHLTSLFPFRSHPLRSPGVSRDPPFLSLSPLLTRPKLAHFKSSCLSAQEALAQSVNIII